MLAVPGGVETGVDLGGEQPHTTVVLAEDHALYAEALAQTLVASGRFEILETVSSGDALVAAWQRHRPDLVVSDLSMKPVGGLEAARAIRALDPRARVCIVSAFEDRHLVRDAVAAGVVGFVSKCAPGPELVWYVTAAAEGRHAFDQGATEALVSAARGSDEGLSARQLEVLRLRAAGLSNAEIAEQLYISVATVKTHVAEVLRKLRVQNTPAAVRAAIEQGLIPTSVSL